MDLTQLVSIMWDGILETLYMTVCSTLLAYLFGIPLGVVLYVTDKDGIMENTPVNKVLGVVVNLLRSVPFLILLVTILPFTRFVVGTTLGAIFVIICLIMIVNLIW